MTAVTEGLTQLLVKWSQGDKEALERLVSLVYPELRRMARRQMAREDPNHILQTSALINEAYLKLIDGQTVEWQNRAHFFAVAAQVMRHILIDHARRHLYGKRGRGAQHVPLEETEIISDERATDLVALDDALNALAQLDARRSQLVELKFFGGLTAEEIAEVMSISPATVQREWRAAKAWLHHAITGQANAE
ncbi:MAG TPA: sigma-70 family RNA polymerase sigma factor [Blastocatellia bacterium]|jgi:RNA polymerase sigma factor (TIGR02999 family)|nr:sigma-70 family RNA polymerase sigma factor [Blastocatellia bacterium]